MRQTFYLVYSVVSQPSMFHLRGFSIMWFRLVTMLQTTQLKGFPYKLENILEVVEVGWLDEGGTLIDLGGKEGRRVAAGDWYQDCIDCHISIMQVRLHPSISRLLAVILSNCLQKYPISTMVVLINNNDKCCYFPCLWRIAATLWVENKPLH